MYRLRTVICLALSLFAIIFVSNSSAQTVKLSYGSVRGYSIKVKNNFGVNIFLGIPFAQPPLGQLRFEKPQAVKPWTGTRDATTWPASCQQHKFYGEKLMYDENNREDCLYLNVFAPAEKSAEFTNGYPVMVWVHGGGFVAGTTKEYGVKGIAERIVPKGVVFVALQYRLAAMGFLSTDDGHLPGNQGMWDQAFGLRWVKDNIAQFGGDPNRVTVFGESAGGASTGLLCLSPHTRDLFQQAILMSGVPSCSWVMHPDVAESTRSLADKLKCHYQNSKEMLQCLRSIDEAVFEKAVRAIGSHHPVSHNWRWGPEYDGDFLPKPMDKLLLEAPKKVAIIGATEREGGFKVNPPEPIGVRQQFAIGESFGFDDFRTFVENEVFPAAKYANSKVLQELLLFHYVHSKGDSSNTTFLVEQFIELFGDLSFYSSIYATNQAKLKAGWKIYQYSFDYANMGTFAENHIGKGAYHTMELPYLFEKAILGEFSWNDEDEKMVEIFSTLFTNFAKYGNPSGKSKSGKDQAWKELTSEFPNQFLSIKPQPEMTNSFRRDTNMFWNDLLPKVLQNFNSETEHFDAIKQEL